MSKLRDTKHWNKKNLKTINFKSKNKIYRMSSIISMRKLKICLTILKNLMNKLNNKKKNKKFLTRD